MDCLGMSVSVKVLKRQHAIQAILLCLVSGCSFSEGPSQREGLAQIRAAYLRDNGCVAYTDLAFSHGFARDDDNYIMVVSYNILFKKDVVSISQKDYDFFLCGSMSTTLLKHKYGRAKLGNMAEEVRQYRFMRTENGWAIRGEIDE